MTGALSAYAAIWDAVDAITRPHTIRLHRDTINPAEPDYDPALTHMPAATVAWAAIPSLWDQATAALTATGTEHDGTPTASGARTPLDTDLMELLATITATVQLELAARDHNPPPATVPARIRRLASIATRDDGNDREWQRIFVTWRRDLGRALHAATGHPTPVRLRTPCPACGARFVLTAAGLTQPPILIDFRDDLIRAAHCQAPGCGATWWRGELARLADLVA